MKSIKMHITSRNSNIYFFVCCVWLFLGFAKKGPCETMVNGCCPDTQWDPVMNMCVDCSPGFFAENCSRQCLYPYYGKKCNEMCSCDNTTCNFMDGCDKGSTSRSVSYETYDVSGGTQNASEITLFVNENTTTPLFSLLMVVIAILGTICMAYTALIFIERQWNNTQEYERR